MEFLVELLHSNGGSLSISSESHIISCDLLQISCNLSGQASVNLCARSSESLRVRWIPNESPGISGQRLVTANSLAGLVIACRGESAQEDPAASGQAGLQEDHEVLRAEGARRWSQGGTCCLGVWFQARRLQQVSV